MSSPSAIAVPAAPLLVIVTGLPGSGKSTFARLAADGPAPPSAALDPPGPLWRLPGAAQNENLIAALLDFRRSLA